MKKQNTNNDNKVKATILFVLGLFCICIISFTSTYAYLQDAKKVINVIGVGTNIIEIEERYEPPAELTPGVSFTKAPKVNNTGNTSVYVRMRALFSDSDAENFCEDLDFDTTNWVYNSDDEFWYYKKAVAAGKSTTELFTTVTVKDSTEQSEIKDFEILIYAESVSAEGISSYDKAW
jgi:Na+-transporting NADH:ubiquinone oxidoreductase subunit NqrC